MFDADRIVEVARGWVGTPYQHQASCKGAGTDCLGLVRGVWREVMGREPELPPAYTSDWAERPGGGVAQETMAEGARRHLCEIDIVEAGAGDVVLFRMRDNGPAKHAAILSGGRRMIHAYSGRAVVEAELTRWWAAKQAYAFRFPVLP